MKAWCSGRGGLPAGGGCGFDSLRPRCRDLTRKIVEMGAGAGQWGPPPIKKSIFFVKIPIFSGFYRFQLCRVSGTRQRLCRVPDKKHSAKLALPSLFLASAVRRVLHSANHLPSVLCLLPSVSGTRQTQGVR